jgi:dienelactone hydrolase
VKDIASSLCIEERPFIDFSEGIMQDRYHRPGMKRSLAVLLALMAPASVWAQSSPKQIEVLLKDEIMSPAVAQFQVQQYLVEHAAKPPKAPAGAAEWTVEAGRLRHHLLEDVVYHGWPKEWIASQPKFEEVKVIETGAGYRIVKLRYEIVPGFESSALLYEPDHLSDKMPAILNVHGHVGPLGQTIEFKQKRCINYARHGIIALSLEWFSFGELGNAENEHFFGADLDLVGANEIGIFYLAMRRGLDYLYNDPHVDRNRIGVTGLSGGGWQTIVLSSLDERVKATNPVAGFSSIPSRVEVKEYGDMGDVEQSATDFLQGSDYPYLVALMAPRPTLLTYNAEDDCCFRATLVKPVVYDDIRPFFKLYGKEDVFQWHENVDPGTHNYQLDNRLADYGFFSKQFGLPAITNEDGVAAELRSYDELAVGLPKDNLTLLTLARKLGSEITRPPIPSEAASRAAWAQSQRTVLKDVVRYKPVDIEQLWRIAMTKHQDVQSVSYLFEMSNRMSANGVWVRSIAQSADTAPVTIVLNDKGKEAGAETVSDRLNRGDQVLALDLMFTGTSWKDTYPFLYAQMIDAVGDRPLGMEAAQLIRIAHWAAQRAGVSKVRLESGGIRSQGAALVAAALEPELFSEVVTRDGMHSLSYLLNAPVKFEQAPELFCLDLFKYFDIDSLEAMAAPAEVRPTRDLEAQNRPNGL